MRSITNQWVYADADAVTEYGSVIVDFQRGPESSQPDLGTPGPGLDDAISTDAPDVVAGPSTEIAAPSGEDTSQATALPEDRPGTAEETAHEGAHRPDTVATTDSGATGGTPALDETDSRGQQERSTDGFVWSHAEDDELNPEDRPVTPRDVREGRVADPNLGDVPVDEQPRRGNTS